MKRAQIPAGMCALAGQIQKISKNGWVCFAKTESCSQEKLSQDGPQVKNFIFMSVITSAPWTVFVPGFMIALTSLCFNIFGTT